MVDLPYTIVDLSYTMVILPTTMGDLPNTRVDIPITMVDLPNTMVDLPRDGKTYKHASKARVNFFLAWVKSVPYNALFLRN